MMQQDMEKEVRRSILRGYSIQRRIPLLIFILLFCVMTGFILISYLTVRSANLNTGKERLRTLSSQLSSMMSQNITAIDVPLKQATSDSLVKRTLRTSGSNASTDSAALNALFSPLYRDNATILTELLSKDGKSVYQYSLDSIEKKINFRALLASHALTDDSLTIGKFYRVRDSIYYPTVFAIHDKSRLDGYLVRWRILKMTQEAVDQLSQLLGDRSKIYLGNTDGSVWSDMMRPVTMALPATMSTNRIAEYQSNSGDEVLGLRNPIANSPWQVLVEFSGSTIVKTASRFLLWMIALGVVIMIFAMIIAWIMSRRLTKPLNELTTAATAIADGDYTVAVPEGRLDEVGKLSNAFNMMIQELDQARKKLEEKITESEYMTNQLRDLSAHLQNIREEERMHISREMHDELGQLLTAFKMDAAWLQKKWGTDINPSVGYERIASMTAAIDEAVRFVRKLAAELRPSMLDDLGLVPALDWYSKDFEKRYNIKVDFHSAFSELEVPPQLATGLFRMYQEALTNVARHSQATEVVSTLTVKDEQLCLSILDNGKGFKTDSNAPKQTLGLLGMKERATMIGGNLEITSTPGMGTHVFIIIPRFKELLVEA